MLKENCPDCDAKLHKGQHKFSDGLYDVAYCKECGFRTEKPM
jgi:hypothetical protein|tara:strand:+ start:296 stop:421 length:126 start_codon:yes stop_codon:yes gene_type:complete